MSLLESKGLLETVSLPSHKVKVRLHTHHAPQIPLVELQWVCFSCNFMSSFSELGRLAGVAFVVPIVNYQWPSLSESVTKDDERKRWYKRMTLVARYAPKLLHWWMIRKTSRSSSTDNFTDKDLELLKAAPGFQFLTADKLKSRSVFSNLRSDFLVAFSKWDFDPLELSNPFPWIQYHEVRDGGHLLIYDTIVCEAILKSLLLGEDTPLYTPKFSS